MRAKVRRRVQVHYTYGKTKISPKKTSPKLLIQIISNSVLIPHFPSIPVSNTATQGGRRKAKYSEKCRSKNCEYSLKKINDLIN